MNDINNKAKEYAESKALIAITSAIEQAYLDGYQAGYQDASSVAPEVIDGVEYIDLGLPSGTKWSATCLKDEKGTTIRLSYEEASKLNIPTREQFEELKHFTKKGKAHVLGMYQEIVGVNSKIVQFPYGLIQRGCETISYDFYIFWLKGEIKHETTRLCAWGSFEKQKTNYRFMGDKLPIMLVR